MARTGNKNSSVYGPVPSWRFGYSLGADPILIDSVCSFRCTYCQLGRINVHSRSRRLFLDAAQFRDDLQSSEWSSADVVTFAGSGEPTLAANLRELIHVAKTVTQKPVVILTNASILGDPAVRSDLLEASHISCKLDATSEEMLQWINRPAGGITFAGIVDGIRALRQDYTGVLSLQVMIPPSAKRSLTRLVEIVDQIKPDEVHLTLPSRARPKEWSLPCRGDTSLPAKTHSAGATATDEYLNHFVAALAGHVRVRVAGRG